MRLFLTAPFVLLAAAIALPARDAALDRRPARRAAEPDTRERLQEYLAAYRRLSPDVRKRVRQLDKDIQDEDPATRSRLLGVMQRYALWLSRLSDEDRKRIDDAPAGPERIRVIREVMEQQWRESLPPARKQQLAKATDAERATLIDRWHKEDQKRQEERVLAQRQMQELGNPEAAARRRQFREAVERFVKTDLEPKLTPKEKRVLQNVGGRRGGTGTYVYLHQVWVFSEAHHLTPPGPPDAWAPFKEIR
jgi:hypothetical protein